MSYYIIPGAFIVIGLAIGWRGRWLRSRQAAVPAMVRITGLFAIWAGIFLAALMVMARP